MKSRLILLVIFLIPLLAACGPKTISGPCPDNLEPMYGGAEKSQTCKAQDDKFIASIEKLGTRQKGADEMARLGFEYLAKGDMQTAMKRFNQAWLLNPENCKAFNGFAIIKHMRDHDSAAANRMFETAVGLCPDNGWLKSDYGRFLEETGQFERAVSMLEQSLSLEPGVRETYKGLIRAHIQLGNDEACLGAIERGKQHGLHVDPRLERELRQRVQQAR